MRYNKSANLSVPIALSVFIAAFAVCLAKSNEKNKEFAMNFFMDGRRGSNSPKRPQASSSHNASPPSSRFATFRPVVSPTRQQAQKAPENGATTNLTQHTYIDILKDREVYEEVRRSRTNEVNSVWSSTFLAFFGLELLLIGSFIIFGLLMFVVLQCKPKKREKHVTLFD